MTDSEGQKQQQNGAGEWKTHATLENSNFILTASLSVLCAALLRQLLNTYAYLVKWVMPW